MVDRVVNLLAANLSVAIMTSILQVVLYVLLIKRIYAICCKKKIEERNRRKQQKQIPEIELTEEDYEAKES